MRVLKTNEEDSSMNLNNYTQKSLEAVQSARDLAVQNGHQQLEQVHLLLALLQQELEQLRQQEELEKANAAEAKVLLSALAAAAPSTPQPAPQMVRDREPKVSVCVGLMNR